MSKFTAAPAVKKQWLAMQKQEQKFLQNQYDKGSSAINDTIEKHMPEKLKTTIESAFCKAFQLVFEKGTGIIEKTYSKDKHETTFAANKYAEDFRQNKRTISSFSKRSNSTKNKNLAMSGIEGIGFGLLGVGLPDIPVFTAMILKSLYEISLSYGYSYDSEEEKLFLLKLIEAAMSHGDELYNCDNEINTWIHTQKPFKTSRSEQIKRTSDSISMEIIYTKFIQTIPLAGVIGGAYDVVYLNRITKYADIKYRRRFLFSKFEPVETSEKSKIRPNDTAD